MSSLAIVMYHYVRDLVHTRYPAIRGRSLSEFRAQLDYIGRNYTVVTAEQVIAAVKGEDALPPNAAWLTFDDGYLDHFVNVFPLLHERGWQGAFFPPSRTILKGEILDVNKAHFILAAQPEHGVIVDEIRHFIDARAEADSRLLPFEQYWEEYAKPNRFDTAQVIFIKRMLQHALPDSLRGELSDSLFACYVSVDPAAFSAELYMSLDHLRMMSRCGMYIGSHGDKHVWLDRVSKDEQVAEVNGSLAFLKEIGASAERWVMCYPYGAYNADLQDTLQTKGCVVGLTTKPGVSNLEQDHPMALPRLDTNDLPID